MKMRNEVFFILFCCITHDAKSTEIIYPAAPPNYLSRRSSSLSGNDSSSSSSNNESGGCDCEILEIVTTNQAVLRKHGELLGRYTKMEAGDGLYNGRPGYEHFSGKFFLYYNTASQGFWAIGERMGSEVVRLENQGDRFCPYYLKSLWRYADGDLNALIYDTSLRALCTSDPCSVAHCGHQAKCVLLDPEPGSNSTDPIATCECRDNFTGDPYTRCTPKLDKDKDACGCDRLIFSTQNPLAKEKHENSYGEYFLFDTFENAPVYQHFAGIEYLYKRDNHWLVSDKIGLHEAGMQNQGDEDMQCPYFFRTHWEYADVEQPGWQWVYDYSAKLVCPNDPCSMNKCGFHSECQNQDGGQSICLCKSGYQGNPYTRCYPEAQANCDCLTLELTSSGPSALAQSDKMGTYHLYGYVNNKPAYQHESGLDYLYFAEGDAWVIGATFGGSRVGVVNFDKQACPYAIKSVWRHSVGGKLDKDPGIVLTCTDPRPLLKATPTTKKPDTADLEASPSSSSILDNNNIDRIDVVTPQPPKTTSKQQQPNVAGLETTICDCPSIIVSSSNEATIAKHGAQLGKYDLIQVQAGRPTYKHEVNEQYLYYHPYSGGNWLINTEVGLLYGGIQNSKDVPVCPYMINTQWQYGDSDLGGWVYDSSLKVICPSDPCSVLQCGFRAECVLDQGPPRCVCREGFTGDPKMRCYPEDIPDTCSCKHVLLSSSGPSQEHQRDKMGEYFLWGYYNDRPVYQHVSGLDFLYYHKNNVWGVGPKIGGNSAGLLNFGLDACPYKLATPWEFGTKLKNKKRQMDALLNLVCLEEEPAQEPLRPLTLRPLILTTTTPRPYQEMELDEGLLKCGMSSDANPHPWQAQIKVLNNGVGRHVCSGVILTEKHVLTSASCLVNNPIKNYMIVVGQNALDELDEWEEEFSAQSVYTHDMFDEASGNHDLAIVKLKQRRGRYINFNNAQIQPICLSAQATFDNSCEISGWGSWMNTNQGLSLMGQSVNLDRDCSSQDLICVNNPSADNQKDFAFDDGMPLTCKSLGEKSYLRGIHAKKLDPCTQGCPMMKFLKISDYVTWINARLAL